MKLRLSSLIIAVATFGPALPAAAQTTGNAASSARAEALFQRGRELFDTHHTKEACDSFRASQALEPKLGTLLNLAVCDEELGLVASAWAEFTSAATQAAREGQNDREKFARDRVAALAKRLPMLTVKVDVAATRDISATLDGQTFPLTSAPLPIDRGMHELVVSAPERTTWKKSFEVKSDGEQVTIDVPPLEEASPPPNATKTPEGATQIADAPEPKPRQRHKREEPGWGSPALAITGFGVGGAGLLIGAIAGGVSLSQTSDLQDTCKAGCPASAADDLSKANTIANVSNAFFIIGGLGVGLGIVGIAVAAPSGPTSAAWVEPIVAPGYAGVRGHF
jgi:hypothetical protein